MLRHIRASRPKTLAIVAALSATTLTGMSAAMWDRWSLGVIARNLALHPDPVTFGLVLSLIPVYVTAIELWLPIRLAAPSDHPDVARRRPMTEAQFHWNAVRVVALICILLIDLVAQAVPEHRAPPAARHRAP